MNKIEELIKELEETLLHSDVRKNPEILNELLDENFEEIGSLGIVSSRSEVINWLVTKEKDMRWSLDEFRVRQLTPELVLAIYQANKIGKGKTSKGSIRSSIWKCYGDKWKMVFHQGTRILEE